MVDFNRTIGTSQVHSFCFDKYGEASAKCPMCGKNAAISDKHDDRGEPAYSDRMVEQIDGIFYIDTADKILNSK